MKNLRLTPLVLLALTPMLFAQTSDFPGGTDLRPVRRPANSVMLGAMHIDDDEYQIPMGPVEHGATKLGKSVTARGPVDVVAYAGPKTASTLTTYGAMSSQLLAAGYTQSWSCVRDTCGDPYTLAGLLAQPLVDAMQTSSGGGPIIDTLYTSNKDVRFGSFHKGAEYLLIVAVLSPGHPSGALMVRVNGPATEPVVSSSSGGTH